MKIILLKGLPASMKSSWAQEQAKTGNYIIVSKDEIRKMFGGYKPSREKEVLRIRNRLIESAIQMRKNVIVDDTNLNPKHERHIAKMARDLGCKFEINDSFLQESPEACIERDLHRGDKAVGASIIWEQYYRWVCPNPIKKLNQEFDKPRCVICDIDGTLAVNDENRSYYDMTRVGEDSVNPAISLIVDALYNYGTERNGKPYPTIILVSGRNESARESTEEWLSKNLIPYDLLYMRKENDSRRDEIVKEEIYHEYIEPYYGVLCAIDDRPRCVRLWQRLGIITLNVGQWGVEY